MSFVLNLQTIKHLSQPELPFTKQSSHGNVALSKALQAMRKFTKVEVLQMVDLNPKTEVELYVVSRLSSSRRC